MRHFFPQKGIIFFFSFSHFFNKIVKQKYKTPFNKLLKGYIYYIFLFAIYFCLLYIAIYIYIYIYIYIFQNYDVFKNIQLQKIKDLIGYGGLHMLQKTMNRSLKYIFLLRQLLLQKVNLLMCYESYKLKKMALKMEKYQKRNLKVFKTNI